MKTYLTKFGKLLLALSLLAGTQAFGQSTIILPTQSFSNINDSATGNGTGGYTLSFAQFDSSLGTLQSVELDLSGVIVSGTVSVFNQSGFTRTYSNVTLVGNYYVSDEASAIVAGSSGNPPNNSVLVTVSTTPTSLANVANGATGTTNPASSGSPGGSSSTILTDPTILALYEGTSGTTINISVSTSNQGQAQGNGTFTVSEASTGSGVVDVIYTYTPVPEPRQTAALMIGFALCVLVGRNYFRRNSEAQLVA